MPAAPLPKTRNQWAKTRLSGAKQTCPGVKKTRSGVKQTGQGSKKQGQGSKKQVAQAGEGCCQLGGPCARTRRFSCVLVTTALVWQQFRTWMYFGRIKNRVWVRLNVKSKRYASHFGREQSHWGTDRWERCIQLSGHLCNSQILESVHLGNHNTTTITMSYSTAKTCPSNARQN